MLKRSPLIAVAARSALAAMITCAGCAPGGGSADMGPPADLAPLPPDLDHVVLGQPIVAPKDTWTWVDFPDAVCDNNTPTGIGIRITASKNLVVFLNGGGACWDYGTCFVLNTSAHGPFGKADFDKYAADPGVIDPSVLGQKADNLFKDWNMVFVPYCTGDNHLGDRVATYKGADVSGTMYHKGHPNIVAYLKRLGPTFPDLDKFVWLGASAGGFGALVNYDVAHGYIKARQSYLIDDSGPPFVGDAILPTLRSDWYAAWNLDATFGWFCPGCKDDLSAFLPLFVAKYPNDRMALLESEMDKVISGFYLEPGGDFKTGLYELATTRLDPTRNFRYYFTSGSDHTMLGNLDGHTSAGVVVNDWIKQMVNDDPSWKSVKPN